MLIPVYEGRPAIAWVGKVPVYVSIHDFEHQRRRDEWRRKFRAHSDTGGSDSAFIKIRRAFDRWVAKEEQWYAAHGLAAPRHGELKKISESEVKAPPKSRPRKLSTQRAYSAKAYQKRLANVAKGLCFFCAKPRGDNGTVRACRPCADVYKTKKQAQSTRQKAKRFTRYYHERFNGPRASTVVLSSQAEKRIWMALGEKHRMSVAHMMRLAMRKTYGYSVDAA
jgi:phenylpyruvate tautomerase PptA (4-oxalocrotonate tautomerase family)